MSEIVKLPFYGKGGWKQSATEKWRDVMDPSTGFKLICVYLSANMF